VSLLIEAEASGSLGIRMRKIKVKLIRCQIVKRLVGVFAVVMLEPLPKPGSYLIQ
jgi:hypothetical protein